MRVLIISLIGVGLIACGPPTSNSRRGGGGGGGQNSGDAGTPTTDAAAVSPGDMVDLGNGVISWPEMEKEWQKVASDTKRNREDSELYCSRLNLGGHSDWVMPGWREYRLICTRSVGEGCSWPSRFGGPCPSDEEGTYWAQRSRDSRGGMWSVTMGFSPIGEFSCSRHDHDTLGVGPINTDDEALRYVRCVRSID